MEESWLIYGKYSKNSLLKLQQHKETILILTVSRYLTRVSFKQDYVMPHVTGTCNTWTGIQNVIKTVRHTTAMKQEWQISRKWERFYTRGREVHMNKSTRLQVLAAWMTRKLRNSWERTGDNTTKCWLSPEDPWRISERNWANIRHGSNKSDESGGEKLTSMISCDCWQLATFSCKRKQETENADKRVSSDHRSYNS